MEFKGGTVARETLYFAGPFVATAFRARWANGWQRNLDAREFAHNPRWRDKMDWKRLVQFALLGSGDLEQYAILLIRVSIGLFFAISGANKLFVAGGTKPVYDTLVKAKVPFPRQTAYFVAGVEVVCGSLLTVGLLSSPACVALSIDMTVATLTSAISTLPKGLSRLNWLDDFLYLPEVLYVLFFIGLICSGPGRFSVDYWLAGQLLG
jgi:putative oxidoreductase